MIWINLMGLAACFLLVPMSLIDAKVASDEDDGKKFAWAFGFSIFWAFVGAFQVWSLVNRMIENAI